MGREDNLSSFHSHLFTFFWNLYTIKLYKRKVSDTFIYMEQFRRKKKKKKKKSRGTEELGDLNSYKSTVLSQGFFFSVGQTLLQGNNSESIWLLGELEEVVLTEFSSLLWLLPWRLGSLVNIKVIPLNKCRWMYMLGQILSKHSDPGYGA